MATRGVDRKQGHGAVDGVEFWGVLRVGLGVVTGKILENFRWGLCFFLLVGSVGGV